MLLLQEREHLGRLVDRDDLQIHTEVAAARLGHLQPVEPLASAGQHDAPGDVHAAGLSRNGLDFLVQTDGVLLQFGDVGVAVHRVHAAGRVPRGTRREFGPLDQQNVLPTRLRQVIQHAGADHAAADHHHFRVALHRGFSRLRERAAARSIIRNRQMHV
jgi:hypothetical protein